MPDHARSTNSAKVTTATFDRDGLSFPYIRYRTTRPRGTIVILHGFAQDLITWQPIAKKLADTHDVLLLRQRGYASTNSPKRTVAYRVSELRKDVAALLNAERIQSAHIVGHDLGGLVAWSFAREQPDRVTTLSAIAMPEARATRELIWSPQIYKLWYILAFQIPRLGESITGFNHGNIAVRLMIKTGLQKALARRYVDEARDINKWHSRIFRWYMAYRYNTSEVTAVANIAAPTLLIWGDADSIVRSETMKLSTKWIEGPHELHCIHGAGHWLPEDRPSEIAQLISEHVSRYSR